MGDKHGDSVGHRAGADAIGCVRGWVEQRGWAWVDLRSRQTVVEISE
jgi:hypothetical protein